MYRGENLETPRVISIRDRSVPGYGDNWSGGESSGSVELKCPGCKCQPVLYGIIGQG
jgi:hypothetical protein